MTDKELKLMEYVISAIGSIHDAIAETDVRPLANALRKLTAMQILIEAPKKKEEPETVTFYDQFGKPYFTTEIETPEKPKLDKAALDIIKEPIADEVPLKVEPEPKIPRSKRVALNDYDTPLDLKAAGTSRDDRILYYRKCGKTLAWIAKQEGCAPQTVANVINRRKAKEEAKLKSEASFARYGGGR